MHLLLSPQPNDFAWVQFAEAVDEAVVIFDVAVSVSELIESCLEDLQHHFLRDRLLLQTDKQIQQTALSPVGYFLFIYFFTNLLAHFTKQNCWSTVVVVSGTCLVQKAMFSKMSVLLT